MLLSDRRLGPSGGGRCRDRSILLYGPKDLIRRMKELKGKNSSQQKAARGRSIAIVGGVKTKLSRSPHLDYRALPRPKPPFNQRKPQTPKKSYRSPGLLRDRHKRDIRGRRAVTPKKTLTGCKGKDGLSVGTGRWNSVNPSKVRNIELSQSS